MPAPDLYICVRDHVSGCTTNEQGDVIFRLIAPFLTKNKSVCLSFKGSHGATPSFVNTCLVPLLEIMPFDDIKRNLTIEHLSNQINEMILWCMNCEAKRSAYQQQLKASTKKPALNGLILFFLNTHIRDVAPYGGVD